ncbi:ATP-binding protein [Pseudomonas mosselii]|uniref:hybrid sensor histidine kinase/response regulator n=1 Tax=Pseudomonas mosselii TaxID=78327 RepID=UPI003F39D5B5
MQNIQNESLGYLRRYQRMLVYGGGLIFSVLVVLVFLMDTRALVTRQVDLQRHHFNSEHTKLLTLLNDRTSLLRNLEFGSEVLWHTLSQPPVEMQPQVFSPLPQHTRDASLSHLRNVASTLRSDSTIERLLRGSVVSSYFYSLSDDGPVFITAPSNGRVAASDAAQEHDVRGLIREITRNAKSGGQDQQQALHWLAPCNRSSTGQRTMHMATAVLDQGAPFAILLVEFPALALSDGLLNEDSKGAYAILTREGQVLTSSREFAPDQVVLQHLADAEGPGSIEYIEAGVLTLFQPLGKTGWFLVQHYSWREFASDLAWPVMGRAVVVLVLLWLIWSLLIHFKLHIFRPLIARSEQLLESERLSRTLIETVPVGLGIFCIDSAKPLLQSPSMVKTQAYIRAQGMTLPQVLLKRYGKQSLPVSGFVVDDITLDTLDGTPVNLSVNMAPAKFRGRNVLVVAFTDTTRKKKLQYQLLKAKQAADRASIAKSSFIASMSHEIRTPLTAIIGNLELLSHSSQDVLPERLEIIRRSSDNLLAIVNDVLDFSKIEAGQLRIETFEFDALDVAFTALEAFAPMAKSKGLVLRGELGDCAKAPLRGDPTRLGQILNNLLSNAIKFTERGHVTLRVASNPGNGTMSFEVEDSGIGMTEDQVERAFDAFNQADESVYRRFGGTGLGLTLCMRLTKAMGGALSVVSTLGQGSAFRLELPMETPATITDRLVFDGSSVLLLTSRMDDSEYLQRVLGAWGLHCVAYLHPALISVDDLAHADTLIIWADTPEWSAEDENRVVEEAKYIIDCRPTGPREPSGSGRWLTTSSFGVAGLLHALRHTLLDQELPLRVRQRLLLPKPLRVLVAEDNPAIRDMLDEQLRVLGCTVQVASSGSEALACLEQERFDVLLTDLSMPEMDGYQLSVQVRAHWPSMPVVAVTAAATVKEHEACEAAGIARVLIKPLTLASLANTLNDVTKKSDEEPLCEPEPYAEPSDPLEGIPLSDTLQGAFNNFCTTSFVEIRGALQRRDEKQLIFELHSLKGALGVYRMSSAAKKLAELERRFKEDGWDAAPRVESFLQALEKVLSMKL